MIYLLLESTQAHADLLNGVAPTGLLHPDEVAHYTSLAVPKRRHDWLLGRWTAKHLIQAALERSIRVKPALNELVIKNDADGAPYAMYGDRLPLSLSISHCDGHAFCGVVEQGPLTPRPPLPPGERGRRSAHSSPSPRVGEGAGGMGELSLGVDMERIETRGWEFVDDFFTADEIAQVRQAAPPERDTVVTAIWSAKEAVLKALRLGLTVDTRRLSVTLETDALDGGWIRNPAGALAIRPFDVVLYGPLAQAPPARLMGWWGIFETYVLTLVLKEG